MNNEERKMRLRIAEEFIGGVLSDLCNESEYAVSKETTTELCDINIRLINFTEKYLNVPNTEFLNVPGYLEMAERDAIEYLRTDTKECRLLNESACFKMINHKCACKNALILSALDRVYGENTACKGVERL